MVMLLECRSVLRTTSTALSGGKSNRRRFSGCDSVVIVAQPVVKPLAFDGDLLAAAPTVVGGVLVSLKDADQPATAGGEVRPNGQPSACFHLVNCLGRIPLVDLATVIRQGNSTISGSGLQSGLGPQSVVVTES